MNAKCSKQMLKSSTHEVLVPCLSSWHRDGAPNPIEVSSLRSWSVNNVRCGLCIARSLYFVILFLNFSFFCYISSSIQFIVSTLFTTVTHFNRFIFQFRFESFFIRLWNRDEYICFVNELNAGTQSNHTNFQVNVCLKIYFICQIKRDKCVRFV